VLQRRGVLDKIVEAGCPPVTQIMTRAGSLAWCGVTDLISPCVVCGSRLSSAHGGIGREIAPLQVEVANYNEDETKYE